MTENQNVNQKIEELSKKFNKMNTLLLIGMVCLGASAMLEIAPLLVVGSVIVCAAVLGQTILRKQYKDLMKDQEEQR